MAPRLVVNAVRFIALHGIFLLDGPRFRPRGRVFYCDDVLERVWTGARPAFDQMPVFARPHEVSLGTEIGDIDHQRLALPSAPRIAKALADVARKMRAAADGNNALPSLALSHIIENRHRCWRLNDTAEATEIGQHRGHATLRHAAVLWIIDSIDVAGAVTRRSFLSPRRRRPILSSSTAWLSVLASGRGLQKSKPELAFCGHLLLDLRRHRRSEEHTSELQSQSNLVCRLLLEKKNHRPAACPRGRC